MHLPKLIIFQLFDYKKTHAQKFSKKFDGKKRIEMIKFQFKSFCPNGQQWLESADFKSGTRKKSIEINWLDYY